MVRKCLDLAPGEPPEGLLARARSCLMGRERTMRKGRRMAKAMTKTQLVSELIEKSDKDGVELR